MSVLDFQTESFWDILSVKEQDYSGNSGPSGVYVEAGDEINWRSDGSNTAKGFKICGKLVPWSHTPPTIAVMRFIVMYAH